MLRTFGRIEGAKWVPIWPIGTRELDEKVVLPSGGSLPFGKNLSVSGRLAMPNEGALTKAVAGCAGQPFFVESANRNFVWNSPAELVAMSDAALVVWVSSVDGRAPLGDGMRTTIEATVLEAISGSGYRSGQQLRLRLPQGLDGPCTAHDRTSGLIPGQRLLLFVAQDLYAEQARARGGVPLAGYIGGTLFYPTDGDRVVNDTDSAAPETLTELRALASGRR